jgi:hypothetical protein
MTRIINDLMYDRGRGPELRSCRITVYDLIPYLEHPETYSDETMLVVWPTVNRAELEAMKAYIAEHREEVMAVHRKIEERNLRGNSPDVRARLADSDGRMQAYPTWLAARRDYERLHNLPEPSPGDRVKAFLSWWDSRHAGTANGVAR